MRSAIYLAFLVFAVATCFPQTGDDHPEPLKITSGPVVEHAGNTDAIIAWSTNLPSGTVVRYGTSQGALSQKSEMPWGSLTHRVELHKLSPGTHYYFQAVSDGALDSGAAIESPVRDFTTGGADASVQLQPVPGEDKVQIAVGPIPRNVNARSAEIWWETNVPSTTIVKYGPDPNTLNATAKQPGAAQNHTVELNDLAPDTTYFFRVQTANGRALAESSLHTLPAITVFRIIDGPRIEYIGPRKVTIAWTTSAPSGSLVHFGTDPHALTLSADAPWGQPTHRVNVQDLQPDTKYYFQVDSPQAQGSGARAESAVFSIRTIADGQQPPQLAKQ